MSDESMSDNEDSSDMISLCLICCSNSSSAISSSVGYQNDNILFDQEQIVFILKHLLQLPSSQLEGYLQTFGNPDQWFNLCDECSQLTAKARKLHINLLKIEEELKGIQRKILETIKSDSTTTEQDNLLHYHHDGQASNLFIWRETRSFVKDESYQNLYLYVKEEPVFMEPERSIIPTPSPPPPVVHDDDVPYQIKEELESEDNSDPDSDIISDNNKDNYLPSPSSSPSPPSSPASKKGNLLTCDICGKTAFSSQRSLSTHRVRIHKAWKIGPHKKRRKTSYPTDKPENRSNDKPDTVTNDKVDSDDVSHPIKKEFVNPNNSEDSYVSSPSSPPLPTAKPKINKDNLLTCDICGKTAFSSTNSLSVHRVRFHKAWKVGPHKKRRKTPYPTDKLENCPTDKPENCPDDDKVTDSAPKDPIPKTYIQTFSCPSCSLTFRSGSKWEIHLQTVHNSEELPCFIENCNRKFYRLKLLLSHLKVHRTGKEFVCPNCPFKLFPDQGTLNHHIRMKHNPEGPPPKPDISRLTCEICGSSKFSSITSLGMHRIKVHKFWKRGPKKKYGPAKFGPTATEGPLEEHLCDLCGSSFNTKLKLKTHIKLKHEKCYPFHCHVCGTGCTCRRTLKMHIIRHHKEEAAKEGLEMYTCEVEGCTKCYLSREQYDKHLREDHGDKDKTFKCEECGKAFYWKGRLVQHQMTHENKGLKCYQCKLCDKGYSIPRYLKRHLRMAHGIKTKRGEGSEVCN